MTPSASPETVPFLDLPGQDAELRAEILSRFAHILETGQYCLGPFVEEFEANFAAYCGAKYCVALNSGTSALHLPLLAMGVGPGDEVIIPPATFVATAWAVSYCGATPTFADIDPVTRTLEPLNLKGALTSRTKAIMPVHLYGMPADMAPILEFAERHGLPVIEDVAQAHGAEYRGTRTGTFGRAAGFSFYPGKNLGAFGEGGAVITNDRAVADTCRMLRDHAQRQRYRHETIGFNYRMDALQGAALGLKLKKLDAWTGRRREVAARYRQLLADCPNLTLPAEPGDRSSVYHLFVVETDHRDRVAADLATAGIRTGMHYPVPVHLQPAYAGLGHGEGSFPNSESLSRRCLSLPMHPMLTDEQVQRVAVALRRAVS